MRLIYILPLGLSLVACATTSETAAVLEEPANPEILKRIEVKLEETRGQPAPALHEVPSAGPDLPSPEVMAEERAALLAEQVALREGVESDLLADDEDEMARKAEALKARIAKDRELMEAEELLSKEAVTRPTLDPGGQ